MDMKWIALENRCRTVLNADGKTLSKQTVAYAILEPEWQFTRRRMLNTPLERKYETCLEYLDRPADEVNRAVRVLNYIYALKRGGLLKDEN